MKLRKLDCRNCAVKTLNELRGLSQLELLDVSGNLLSNLDESLDALCHLQSLRHLDMYDNPICRDNCYFGRVLEATLSHHLLYLDCRDVEEGEYRAVLAVVNGEVVPEDCENYSKVIGLSSLLRLAI